MVQKSDDYKVMDFHGVAPAHLFAGQNSYLQTMCQKGQEALPKLRDHFDLCVVHSDFTRDELVTRGYDPAIIHKLPLCVDTTRFEGEEDEQLSDLLSKLEYFLFVGRIVPQKDILALLEIFAHIHKERPNAVLILVGSRHLTGRYQRQINRTIKEKGLDRRVMFTGQVNDPATLASLFRNASLLFVTSEWESFCVPVVESMYFGTPAIVHDVPPLPEVAGPGGIVIDKRRPLEAAKATLKLLNDPELYKGLSHSAQERSAYFTDRELARTMLRMMSAL
jgi:glycosyltransferase involved in cell wall biosynthesis